MALIKCPECGKSVSDTAKTCPHCGYELRGSELEMALKSDSKDSNLVVVLRRNRESSSGAVAAITIVGVLLIPLFIGIIMVILGIMSSHRLKLNSNNDREVLYYDKKGKEFVIVCFDGKEYRCEPSNLRRSITNNNGTLTYKQKYAGAVYSEDMKNIQIVLSSIK